MFFVFMGIFTASFLIGSVGEFTDDKSEAFFEEFQSLVEGINAIGIFVHNTTIALPMILLGFGVAWNLFTGSTGFGFAAIVDLKTTDNTLSISSVPFGVL